MNHYKDDVLTPAVLFHVFWVSMVLGVFVLVAVEDKATAAQVVGGILTFILALAFFGMWRELYRIMKMMAGEKMASDEPAREERQTPARMVYEIEPPKAKTAKEKEDKSVNDLLFAIGALLVCVMIALLFLAIVMA